MTYTQILTWTRLSSSIALALLSLNVQAETTQTELTQNEVSQTNIAQAKIANGVDTSINQAPWQVAMATLNQANGGFRYSRFCAGTLISDRWIVSAAHCFQNSDNKINTHAVIGEQNLAGNVSLRSFYKVKRFVERPDYNAANFNNDIILIELAEPVDFNNCNGCKAATWSNNDADSLANTSVFVAGWGATESLPFATTLQSTTLNIVNCVSNITGLSYTIGNLPLSPNTICAQSKATPASDTCQGDSGSGLIINPSRSPTLVGITSFSIKANSNGLSSTCNNSTEFPGGYTKVSNYCQWIAQVTGLSNNCIASNQVPLNSNSVTAAQNSSTTERDSAAATPILTSSNGTLSGGGSGGGSLNWGSVLLLGGLILLRRLLHKNTNPA